MFAPVQGREDCSKFSRMGCRGAPRLGSCWPALPGGVVGSGELDRILNRQDPAQWAEQAASVVIFRERMPVVTSTAGRDRTLPRKLKSMVDTLILNLGMLERAMSNGGQAQQRENFGTDKSVEEEVLLALVFLRHIFYSFRDSEVRDKEILVDTIKRLLPIQGCLSSLPRSLMQDPVRSNLVHLWLEVRWTLLVGTFYLSVFSPDLPTRPLSSPLTSPLIQVPATVATILRDSPWFYQLVFGTLLDIARVSLLRVGSASNAAYPTDSVFACPCLAELTFSIHQLCEKVHLDFWRLLSLLVSEERVEVEQPLHQLRYDTLNQEGQDLVWHLATSTTSLLTKAAATSSTSLQQEKNLAPPSGLYKGFIIPQLKTLFHQMELHMEEGRLRRALVAVDLMLRQFGPSLEILTQLWTFFSHPARMNSTCRISTLTLEGSACLPKSGSAWKSLILDYDRVNSSTSYLLFIRIVATSISFWSNQNSSEAKEVSKLCGRIPLKLSAKTAVVMTDQGVYHVGTLLLTIITLAKQENFVTVLMDFLKKVEDRPGHVSTSLQVFILTCRLATVLCCVCAKLPVDKSGLAVTSQLHTVVTQYQQNQSDVMKRRETQDCVALYVDTLTEVVEESEALDQGEFTLIDLWTKAYIGICSTNEVATILTSVNKLVTRAKFLVIYSQDLVSKDKKNQLKEGIEKLWRVFYPVVKEQARGLTAPPCVAILAADFLGLALEADRKGMRFSNENVHQMFQYFKPIQPCLCILYLERVVENCQVLERLEAESPQFRSLLLERFVLCSLQIPPGSPGYVSVVSAWPRLAEKVGLSTPDSLMDDEQTEDILRSMILHLRNTQYSQVLLRLSEECKPKLNQKGGNGARLYRVGGWLAKYAMHVIYSPGNFQLLIDNILTPRQALAPDWIPTQAHLDGVSSCLGDFLKGISSVKTFCDDPFLQRKITEIIQLYLPKFPVTCSPLLPLLTEPGLALLPSSQSTMCKVTVKQLMSGLLSPAKYSHLILDFIKVVLQSPQSHTVKFLVQEMTPLLAIFLNEDRTARDKAVKVMERLLPLVINNQDLNKHLEEKILIFIKKIPSHSERCFKTLRVFVSLSPFILDSSLIEVEKTVANNRHQGDLVKQLKELKEHIICIQEQSYGSPL